MYISHIEKQTEEVKVIDKLICDCCGEEIPKISKGLKWFWEHISLQTNWGYYCNIFNDGEKHKIEVCEKCYANWISNFKYSPSDFGQDDSDIYLDESKKSDQELFEEWKSRYKNKSN